MKNRVHILFFVVSFLVYHTAFTQENFKKTKIVATVFKALKKQNEQKFLKGLPSKDDILYLIPIIRAAQPNENIPEADTIIANFKMKATENFRKVIKRGSSFGVKWEDMALEKVEYKANPDPKVDIERGNITLVCSSNDKKFLIILNKSSKIRGSWKLMNTMKFTLL